MLDHRATPFSVFLRNCHTVFHHGCTSLRSQKQGKRGLPYPRQHLLLVDFLRMAIMISERWYLTVFLMCVSLRINDDERLFLYLLAICMSSLRKCLFRSSAHFLIGFFLFLIFKLYERNYVLWKLSPCWSYYLQIFSPILYILFFVLFYGSFPMQKLLSSIRSYLLFLALFIYLT